MNIDQMKKLAGTAEVVKGAAPKFVIPPCHRIFDKAWFCVTPMNQISKVYVTGDVEDCMTILTDWTLCMQAKVYYKEVDKQRIMSKAGIYKTSTHTNKAWDLKEKPAWLTRPDTKKLIAPDDDFDPKNYPTFDEDE